MAQVHFLKVNVNSSIFMALAGEVNINEYLYKLYEEIDDEKIFKLKTGEFKNIDGERIEVFEQYCFSELEKKKEGTECSISGKIVRRFPKKTEQYDPKTKKSDEYKIPNNAASIIFYFDVTNEIVTFIRRQSFGPKQFVNGFEGLINEYKIGTDFNVQFKKDPFSVKENLKSAYKIVKLRTVNVMPNALTEELEKFMGLSENIMKDTNANKLTMDYEASPYHDGIDKNSAIIKSIINDEPYDSKSYRGYESVEFDAIDEEGFTYHYDSDKDSLLTAEVNDFMSKSLENLIKVSQKIIRRINIKEIRKRIENNG